MPKINVTALTESFCLHKRSGLTISAWKSQRGTNTIFHGVAVFYVGCSPNQVEVAETCFSTTRDLRQFAQQYASDVVRTLQPNAVKMGVLKRGQKFTHISLYLAGSEGSDDLKGVKHTFTSGQNLPVLTGSTAKRGN